MRRANAAKNHLPESLVQITKNATQSQEISPRIEKPTNY
jgi:hypothetical protein